MSDDLILPNVELPYFTFESGKPFITYEGEKRQIVKVRIYANGLHDLCYYINQNGAVDIGTIGKVPPERIMHRSNRDLLWLVLVQPIGTQRSIIFEINDSVKEVIPDLIQCLGSVGKKGKDYEMYGGGDYGI